MIIHHRPVALVTGGSRGIGRGISIALAKKGYAVAVNYAGNRIAAEETCALIDDEEAFPVHADVGNTVDRINMVRTVVSKWGRIDLLVNNAGITSLGRLDILEATEESWDTVLGINLKGPFFLSKLVANHMLEIGPANLVRPAIINITSLSAFAASVNRGDYCVSKAGMSMMTQLFALRLADKGIRVFEVRPGIIDTDMTSGAREKYVEEIKHGLTPIPRLGTAEEVGKTVASIATADMPFSTGDIFHADGGFHLRKL
ncbi:3-ketoacyl-ACP reductase [Zavarzinella formosa]|uniref:3-ketoacyl-ACP reductase n=1 Tax=Zavarzinella formosa TaxID=360055 RepID=UPI00031CAE1B|nr:3-ketoacyl-ACP reductase [Zavarzinella formosa]